jgi:gamma-glutamyltranspeptidase/glutathione hydrolase
MTTARTATTADVGTAADDSTADDRTADAAGTATPSSAAGTAGTTGTATTSTAATATAGRDRLRRRAAAAGSLGAVAASSPVAAAIGTAVLLDGGNCVDAALAAALAETVVLAPKCGLAGDVVALHLRPGAAAPDALVAVGPAPAGLADAIGRTGGLPLTGGLSVGVPGAPAGYVALAALARLSLADLCAPAVALAERGFAWSDLCAALAAEADDLLVRHQPGGCRYRPAGGALAAGAHLRLPGLATLLEAFAATGADLFAGAIGDAVAARVRDAGGVLDRADLTTAHATWSPADSGDLTGATMWSTPAPTFGPALLATLADGAADDGALARSVAAALDRQARTGDPYRPGPGYGGRPANRSGDAAEATPGAPALLVEGEGTSVVAAADADGGAVVIVHSNSFPQFGSGLVVDDLDLILANRAGRGFASDPNHPDFPAPGRRPRTTLHAWAFGRGTPTLLGGTPGGAQQVPWNAQVLTALARTPAARPNGGEDPAAAVTRPLWRLEAGRVVAEADWLAADPTTADPTAADPTAAGPTEAASATAEPTADGSTAGETTPGTVATVAPLSMRSAQVIVAPAAAGGLARAWADPRHATIALAV